MLQLAQAAGPTAFPPALTPHQEQLPGDAGSELHVLFCGVHHKPRNGVQKEIAP